MEHASRWRPMTLAWAAWAAAGLALELPALAANARLHDDALRTLSDHVDWLSEAPLRRAALAAFWLWLGYHFWGPSARWRARVDRA